MPGGTYNLCESNQKLGRTRCYVSLMQKLVGMYNLYEQRQSSAKVRGMYNLCEHRQTSAKVRGNVQPL
jgi:hypothetical protein